MKIPPPYFVDSFISDFFELSGNELNFLLERGDQTLRIKLLMLDVWGRVCLRDEGVDQVRQSLGKHLSFETGGTRR